MLDSNALQMNEEIKAYFVALSHYKPLSITDFFEIRIDSYGSDGSIKRIVIIVVRRQQAVNNNLKKNYWNPFSEVRNEIPYHRNRRPNTRPFHRYLFDSLKSYA